jgi:hypothetical protein
MEQKTLKQVLRLAFKQNTFFILFLVSMSLVSLYGNPENGVQAVVVNISALTFTIIGYISGYLYRQKEEKS